MSQQERSSRMAVLLFTDMVDSVALERRLGTDAYSRLLQQHHRLFQQVLDSLHAGEIRNDTGDGILCEFSTAAAAVKAALLFQSLLRENRWEQEAPKVRIGIHQGQLAEFQLNTASPGKLVGLPVSIAARIMSLAQGGQILMTRPVYDDARQFVRQHPVARPGCAPLAIQWRAHGQYLFKGSEDSIEIFEVGAVGFAPLAPPPDTDKAQSPAPAPALKETTVPPSPLVCAGAAVVCGLILWATPFGEAWVEASYDYQFCFVSRAITNNVALVLMDKAARKELHQTQLWDRALHARLLNQLASDGCRLVVFDVHFETQSDAASDSMLAEAMRKQGHVVLMADVESPTAPRLNIDQIKPPYDMFRQAAAGWGIANAGVALLETPRRIWPYPSPGDYAYPSLPWAAAQIAGATLNESPVKRWMRYYREKGAWESWSYHLALSNAPGYFRNKIVFIGHDPDDKNDPNYLQKDKFCSPYTRWNSKAVGGVEVIATTFLNLVNGDWLRRFPWPVEGLLLVVTGFLLGGVLGRCSRLVACAVAIGFAFTITLGAVCLTQLTNSWFPWLIVVGGQAPCALACVFFPVRGKAVAPVAPAKLAGREKPRGKTVVLNLPQEPLPDAPEYEFITPHFGEGGFGKVWVVRNAIGQWQALKAVYQLKFGDNRGPYEAEFKGLQRYKPVSEKHPGLLRIDLISKMKAEGYFYYVMELGDAMSPGWEKQPHLYKPRDLENLRKQAYGRRLPPTECLRVGTVLADALNFLHSQGLTHRDIKPSNVIFVNGRPKLADVGLVADIRPPDKVHTLVGTLGYLPPPPEKPGTPQADIYALGMLLYVISTGRDPDSFPDLSTTLMERSGHAEFIRFNAIVLKACQPDLAQRYKSTAEMLADLRQMSAILGLN